MSPTNQTMGALCCDNAPKSRQLHRAVNYRSNAPAPPTTPPPGYVRVRVLAAGIAIDEVNTAERTFLGRFGSNPKNYSKERPLVPGLECCGVIVAVNNQAPTKNGSGQAFKVGDVVIGLNNPLSPGKSTGTWAEYALVSAASLEFKPAHLTPEESVASFMTGMVVVVAMQKIKSKLDAAVARSEKPTVVVCGASGSIGTLCLEAIKHLWPNSERIAICSSKSAEVATASGATRVVAYDQAPKWGAQIKKQAHAVIDLVGGPVRETQGAAALRKGGVFMTLVGPQPNLGDKRLSWWSFIGFASKFTYKLSSNLFRSYTYAFGELSAAKMELWRELQNAKVFHPVVETVVDLKDKAAVSSAIQQVTSHHVKGKVVIHVADE